MKTRNQNGNERQHYIQDKRNMRWATWNVQELRIKCSEVIKIILFRFDENEKQNGDNKWIPCDV